MAYYLAVDLGTTGCRSIIFDESLRDIGSAYEEYGLITPKEKYTEQDAELWWTMTVRTAKLAIKKAGIDGTLIRGISVSSQGITVVPVDESCKPLSNAISWLDCRAEDEVARLHSDIGHDAMFRLTGKPISASYTLPKLMWMREHNREVFDAAYKFLMPLDFLIARFTGCYVTDHSMASGTLMYDLKNAVWCDSILERYGIPKCKLPELRYGDERIGCVLPDVADEIGLSRDCVVAMGAQDQKCAAYGAGLCDGVMTVSLGTAAAITKLWREAKTEIDRGIGWCGYATGGAFVTEGVIGTAGTCLRWVRDMLYPSDDYKTVDAEAAEAMERGSSLLFMPYMDSAADADGKPTETGCFHGVNLATTRGDFALAVMEGVAFRIREILEAMEAYGNVHTVIILGGGAKSPFWCQLISDITGMTLVTPSVIEAAGAGAAMLAAKAAGDVLSPLGRAKEYAPSERSAAYERKYKAFLAVKERMLKEKD